MPRERSESDIAREKAPPPPEPLDTERAGVGTVKFWLSEKGHGAISMEDIAPWDIWAHFSSIAAEGFKELSAGQRVEVKYRRADQDSFKYVAIWVRALP
jgi:cold shock protein